MALEAVAPEYPGEEQNGGGAVGILELLELRPPDRR